MSVVESGSGERKAGGRLPAHLGPTLLLVVCGFFVAVVLWGYFNPADIRVEYFDAGPARSFEIARVQAFPAQDIYVVGLEDGRLRAIDGRVASSGCTVRWLDSDDRGRAHNPRGLPGVFEDPCTGAYWSMLANAIEGSREPLRTPYIDYRPAPGSSEIHAFIERVNP